MVCGKHGAPGGSEIGHVIPQPLECRLSSNQAVWKHGEAILQESGFRSRLYFHTVESTKCTLSIFGRCGRLLSPAHSKMWRCPPAKSKDPMSHQAYPRAQAQALTAVLLHRGDCQVDEHIGSSKRC